jgi:ribosomal protein S18 acetylase RimI-like enzyme
MKNNYEFRLINISDIMQMSDLLISRQNIESEEFPFLMNKCLNAKYISERLHNLFNNHIIGMGAFLNNELAGYLFGSIRADSNLGRYVSVPYEGVAVKSDESYELVRKLYAKVSELWLQQGCFTHSIVLPVGHKTYYEAFLQLSYAIEQVYAVMDLEKYVPFEQAAEVNVRLANNKDNEALGRMSDIIAKFHNSAPVFEPVFPETLKRRTEAYKELVEEENDDIVLIAENDNEELGFLCYELINPNLMMPDNAIELSIAGTYSTHMGAGIGKKLVNEGCRIIRERGYEKVITDWRISNLAASAFWPKCGFKPIAYRMNRYIDKNYAWANLNNPAIKDLD